MGNYYSRYVGTDGLIEAIFIQAKQDYITASIRLKRRPGDIQANKMKKDVERFLRSPWAMELAQAEITFDKAIAHMDKEAEKIYQDGRRQHDRVHYQNNEERG